jgi:hypothetical protein
MGNKLSGVDVDTLLYMSDWSLASASNLAKLQVSQLGKLGSKLFGMNETVITTLLDGLNVTALVESLELVTGVDYAWSTDQALAFQRKLAESQAWGEASAWTSKQIGSLGTILTGMEIDTIKSFSNSALANAASRVKLSAAQLTNLSNKVGSMIPADFASTINGVNAQRLHAAMLEQCEIQCESDSDEEFLRNPSAENAAQALEDYAKRVREKSDGAVLAYSNAFCSGSPTNTSEATALLQSAAVACTGSVKKNNALRASFEDWAKSQKNSLVSRLVESDALGGLVKWSETEASSLCHQYAALSPSRIAEFAAGALISASAKGAIDAALVSAFGPYGGAVASFAVSQAADKIEPEQRASWTSKLTEGLGTASKWGCTQVASLRTLAAGLNASELSSLTSSAIRGILPKAVTAMEAAQIKGFTPEGIVAMSANLRNRISGDRLSMLQPEQMMAAVCGSLNATEWLCPDAVVDFTMAFPASETPSTTTLYTYFTQGVLSLVNLSSIQIMSVLEESDRPLMLADANGGRRLSAGSTEVTMRIGVPGSMAEMVETRAQSAAVSFTKERSGNVVEPASIYTVRTVQGAQGQGLVTSAAISAALMRLSLLAMVCVVSLLNGAWDA